MDVGAPPGRAGPMVAMAATIAGALGAAIALVLLTGLARPTDFLLPGATAAAAPLIAEDFPGTNLPAHGGYDGQQYYAMAVALPDLEAASQHLDAPRYRLERVFAPAVASLAPDGMPTLLTLVALNILGAALAGAALGELCVLTGRRRWLGVLGILPLTVALVTTTVDPVATGLLLMGLVLVERRSYPAAAAIFALGALTRESVAIFIVAAAIGVALDCRRWVPPAALIASLGPLALWHWYLSVRIGGDFPSKTALLAVFGVPWGYAAVTVTCTALCVLGAITWRRHLAVAAVAAAGALQIPFLASEILDWAALPRVTAAGVALGLVPAFEALSAATRRRGDAPAVSAW